MSGACLSLSVRAWLIFVLPLSLSPLLNIPLLFPVLHFNPPTLSLPSCFSFLHSFAHSRPSLLFLVHTPGHAERCLFQKADKKSPLGRPRLFDTRSHCPNNRDPTFSVGSCLCNTGVLYCHLISSACREENLLERRISSILSTDSFLLFTPFINNQKTGLVRTDSLHPRRTYRHEPNIGPHRIRSLLPRHLHGLQRLLSPLGSTLSRTLRYLSFGQSFGKRE